METNLRRPDIVSANNSHPRWGLNGITRLPNFPRRVADWSRDRTIESNVSQLWDNHNQRRTYIRSIARVLDLHVESSTEEKTISGVDGSKIARRSIEVQLSVKMNRIEIRQNVLAEAKEGKKTRGNLGHRISRVNYLAVSFVRHEFLDQFARLRLDENLSSLPRHRV